MIAAAIHSDGAAAEVSDIGLEGVGAFFTLPFQLTAVWLMGSFSLSASFEGQSMEVFSLWAPNIPVLVLAAAAAIWGGRLVSRKLQSRGLDELPITPRLTLVGLFSLGLSLFLLLLTWALAFRATEESSADLPG